MGKDYKMFNVFLHINYTGLRICFRFKKKIFHKILRHCLAKNRFDFYAYQLLCTHFISSSLRSSPSHDVRKPSTLDLQ